MKWQDRLPTGRCQQLVCLISGFVLIVASVPSSLCAPSPCSAQESEAAHCVGMDVPRGDTTVHANSSSLCCQLTGLPATTIGQERVVEKAKAAISSLAVSGAIPSGLTSHLRTILRRVDLSPPHDVQSLFCTLLI